MDLRVLAEYKEMPGLGLTVVQAARLFGLGPETAAVTLRRLEGHGFLGRTRDGRFVIRRYEG